MRIHYITTLLIMLPFFASAQIDQRMQMHQQMNAQNQKWASERLRDENKWSQQAMFNQLHNQNSKAQKTLHNEEKKKQKLEEQKR